MQRYRKVPLPEKVLLCVPEVCVADEPCPSSNVTLCPFAPRHVQVTVAPAVIGDEAGAKKLSHTLTDVALPPLPQGAVPPPEPEHARASAPTSTIPRVVLMAFLRLDVETTVRRDSRCTRSTT